MFHIPEMPATGTGGTGGANRAASGVSFVDREGCDRPVPAHPGNGNGNGIMASAGAHGGADVHGAGVDEAAIEAAGEMPRKAPK